MAEFKLTLNDSKTGKSYKREVKDQNAAIFLGKKIADAIKGESIDLQGYEFIITGGSDNCGFPMRAGITGSRKEIYAYKGTGIKKKRKGCMQRKTVCGMIINDNITQINLKITKFGKEALEKPAEGKAEEKKPEAKKEEAKAEENKEKPAEKEEEKKDAKEEKPAEKKETPKEERKSMAKSIEIDTTKLKEQWKKFTDYIKNMPADELYSWLGIVVGVILLLIGIILIL